MGAARTRPRLSGVASWTHVARCNARSCPSSKGSELPPSLPSSAHPSSWGDTLPPSGQSWSLEGGSPHSALWVRPGMTGPHLHKGLPWAAFGGLWSVVRWAATALMPPVPLDSSSTRILPGVLPLALPGKRGRAASAYDWLKGSRPKVEQEPSQILVEFR